MNKLIEQSAMQIKEIVDACRGLAESFTSEDEKQIAFSIAVVALTHEYMFKTAPKDAVRACNKVEYAH